ncbi:hypothetical protein GCM10011348_13630 [Marinobacterium nitratireducens]|uniref:Uncharacterized protein n=1 Tax=Marinobacterium nitratireducens TaxID=518897 RepID=A0A918DRS6_9GAMM|nr:hypothetical protein [Marinobacterium nitratireducens]GGO79417.1 hypothetical protein GCM10011348_13630 [Marinobacterium nitratireducens]
MSELLTQILEKVRVAYVQAMQEGDYQQPYLTAERLCHEQLHIDADALSRIIDEDPTLLAARAGELVQDPDELDNPSVGAIICYNIVAAAMDGLLTVAVEHDWLDVDEEGNVLVDDTELHEDRPAIMRVDYSRSAQALENAGQAGASRLSKLFHAAEAQYVKLLDNEVHDAYQLALRTSSDYAIFAPEDIAPLVAENPLLLGLRPDGLVDPDLFEGDPPAGIIISSHLTHMLLQQLLEIASERGALARDSSGHLILPAEDEESSPQLH